MRPQLVRLSVLLFGCFFLAASAHAQNCGQRDTIIFLDNSTASVDLVISEYFNNDLSDPMQGLCGVEVGFVHQFVENLEISLTSPAGQTVNLIGPNSDDGLDFTLGTQWNISFVPCLEMAEPDSAFTAQWDNEQTENWLNFGNYTGSYYPFQGCLEDFNTGTVNGTWTFNVVNNPSNNPGAITYLRLIFCDSRGVECCFAEAGQWINDDILTCEGNDTLLIDPILGFPLGMADTTEYDYAYLIHQDGVYLRLDSVLDLRSSPPGIYDICGFSYRSSQLDSLPLPDGIITLDSIRNNLTGLEPWLCAALSPTCLNVEIVGPPDTTRLNERICAGDSIVVGELAFLTTDFYTVDLLSEAGCDSIVTLDLFVQELQETFLTETICPGDSFVVGNIAYFETGIYQDTLTTAELGCDSIVQLELLVLSDILLPLDSVICQGDQVQIGDSIFQDPGNYQVVLEGSNGCDSLVQLELLVLDPEVQINGIQTLNCQTPSISLEGENTAGLGVFAYQWFDENNQALGTNTTQLIDQEGDYFLEITQTFDNVSCTNRDTAVIASNFSIPIADAGPDTTINCFNPVLNIGGSGTSIGINYLYEWQTTNGTLSPPTDQPMLSLSTAGDYSLIVRDTFSFCADTATVNVIDQSGLPEVIIADGFTLNCQLQQDTLDGSASLLSTAFMANWSGPCITTQVAPAIVIVDCPGWYFLDIENTLTGCTNRDSILITEDIAPATANIIPPLNMLDCIFQEINLDASTSEPSSLLSYTWQGPGLSSNDQAQTTVNQGGTYQLTVTRSDNFCQDIASILITQDTLAPIADVGSDVELNCNLENTLIAGNNSSSGPTITYQWLANNMFLPGATDDSLFVTTSGIYVLEVSNAANGCRSRDTVDITEDFFPPELVEAGPDLTINCAGDVVFLTPDSTGFSRPVDWEWEGTCFSTPNDTWSVGTDCAGVYTLTVTNQDNGCSASDDAMVTTSSNFSEAILVDETVALDCDTGTATLNTTGSVGSVFQWFRDDISISLPNNNPVINQAGMYTLVTSNLSMICTDTARTEVIIDCPLAAAVTTPDILSCRQNIVELSAAASTISGAVTYQWNGPDVGCFLGDTQQPNVAVICEGTYELIIEQPLFGQRDTTMVEVMIDTIAPIVEAGMNLQVTCDVPLPTLTGTVVGNPNDYSFAWTNFAGNDTLSNMPNLSTDVSGSYFFIVENNQNGCISRDLAQITLNNAAIDLAFGGNIFPCLTDTFQLEAFVNPNDPNYTYQWSGPGIIANADSSNVLINSIGDYTLMVENPTNGCNVSDNISVEDQICLPCIDLPATDTLNCITNEITVNANFCTSCDGCVLQWNNENGPINGATSLDLTISTAGSYTLVATDTQGFSGSATIEVLDLSSPPLLDLGSDQILNCDSSSYTLQNQLDNNIPDLDYVWSLIDGTVINDTDTTLTVTAPNNYILTLTNSLSLCTISDTINISEDFTQPMAEAGSEQQFTCANDIVVLDGTGSTLVSASYLWTGPDANCLAGATTTTPIASCEGWYFLEVSLNQSGCTVVDSVLVSRNEVIPTITPIPDTLINCLQPEVVLQGNAPTPDGYSSTWCQLDAVGEPVLSSCLDEINYTVNTGGDYQYTLINDTTLCSNTYTVTVSVDSLPPLVDAGLTDTLNCGIASLTLNASADDESNLLWTGPDEATITPNNSLMPTIDRNGWYYLQATSSTNGCSAMDSVFIVIDENIPTVDAGLDTLLNCNNETIQLTANGNTNSGQEEWQWTSPMGVITSATDLPQVTVADSAWYFVSLTDPTNNCLAIDSVFVGADYNPPTAIVDGIDTVTCAQDTLTFSAINSLSSTGNGLTYNWQVDNGLLFPNLNAVEINTDRAGTYRLVVTDQGNGCLDTFQFNIITDIEAPELVLATPDSLGCSVDSVLLQPTIPTTTAGLLLAWQAEDGTVISEDFSTYVYEDGTYSLLVESITNGCTQVATVEVIDKNDEPLAIITPPFPLSCVRSSVELDASASSVSPNLIYQWRVIEGNLLGTTISLIDSTDQAGSYQFIVMDTLTGCQQIDTVEVIDLTNPILGIRVEASSPLCDEMGNIRENGLGDISVDEVFGGTPPYFYSLNGGPFEMVSFFEDLPIGTYNLRIRDNGNCQWEEEASINQVVPVELELGPDIEINLGESIHLDPQFTRPLVSFYWESFGFFPPTTTLRPLIEPHETQYIILTVQDENNCIAIDTMRIFVDDDLRIFVPTAFSPNGDGNNDELVVYGDIEIPRIRSFRVFSRWGNMVYERINFRPNDPFGWDGTHNGVPLNPGVFVYEVEFSMTARGVRRVSGEVVLVR